MGSGAPKRRVVRLLVCAVLLSLAGTLHADELAISIESALDTEFFTDEEADERYVRLRGEVVLRAEDRETGVVHWIIAEEVVYNQTEELLTASRGVEYRIERPDSVEVFEGRSLSFDLEDWSGAFLEGQSRQPRRVEGEDLVFRFSGAYITRSPEDVVVIEDGVITSSEADPPNYRLQARRIWVFGPGEWAVRGGTLYVGRVPVFYLPFLFMPGDRLFFNPAIGYRSREGGFLQTTTYLIGRRPPRRTPLAFLQPDERPAREELERDGLFLRPTGRPDDTPEDRSLRLLLDYYTRLGGLAALRGELGEIGPFSQFEFRTGIGVSRHLYERGDGFYTPYREVDGRAQSDWNRSRFLGLELPFRYELATDFGLRPGDVTLSGTFTLLSDPFFRRDFDQRDERMDWMGLLGLGEIEEARPAVVSSLLWRLRASYSAPTAATRPYLTTASLTELSSSLFWSRRATPENQLDDRVLQADESPEREFFYPDRMTTPNLSMRFAGTLLDTDLGRPSEPPRPDPEPDQAPDPRYPVRPPWQEVAPELDGLFLDPAAGRNVTVLTSRDLRPPPGAEPLPDPDLAPPVRLRSSWSLTPRLRVESFTDSADWDVADDIDFALRYSRLTSENALRLNYGADVQRRLFVLSNSIVTSARYRNIFNDDRLTESARDSLELQAYRFTRISTEHNLDAATYPLQDTERWSESHLRYELGAIVHRREFDRLAADGTPIYRDEGLGWDEDLITRHRSSLNMRVRLWNATQSLTLRAIMPPLLERYEAEANAITGPVTTNLQTGIRETVTGDYVWDPLIARQRYRFHARADLEERLVYDIEEEELTSSVTTLRLWWLRGVFRARTTESFRFDPDAVGDPYERRDDRRFRPESATLGVRLDHESDPYWRNRVRWGLDLRSDLEMDFLRFTESSFDIEVGLRFDIYRFLDLRFSSLTRNTVVYQYVPALAERADREQRNPFADLARSFNFFDREDREASFFNLERLQVEAIMDLDDWVLTLRYSGSPELRGVGPERRYEWVSEFAAFLVWRPIPEVRGAVDYDDGEWQFEN